MTLAQKIEKILKDELQPENIKTVIEIAESLKYKESQKRWYDINESELEYITETEKSRIEEVKAKGEFITQEKLLKELEIRNGEVHN